MSKTYRFGCAADVHLRDMQYSRRERGIDSRLALEDLVKKAVTEKLDALFIAGDLLDVQRPSSSTLRRCLRRIQHMAVAAKLPIYVVDGDHDEADPNWITILYESADEDFIPEMGLIALKNQTVTIPGTDVTLHGLGFIGKTKERFMALKGTLPVADILLWHTTIREFCHFPSPMSVELTDLEGMHYGLMCIGDIHVSEEATLTDGTLVVSPGATCLQQKSESFEKTFTVISMEHGGKAQVEKKVPLYSRMTLGEYEVSNDAEAAALFVALEKVKDQDPLVFIAFNPRVENFLTRLHAVIDPTKAILVPRPKYYDDIKTTGMDTTVEQEDLKPVDFLGHRLAPGTKVYDLGAQLLNSETRVAESLDAFITQRLSEYATAAEAA